MAMFETKIDSTVTVLGKGVEINYDGETLAIRASGDTTHIFNIYSEDLETLGLAIVEASQQYVKLGL